MKVLSAVLYVLLGLIVVGIFRRFFPAVPFIVVCIVAALVSYFLQPILYYGIAGFLGREISKDNGTEQDKSN